MNREITPLLNLVQGLQLKQPLDLPFSIIPMMYESISTKELLHSKILAELLNPQGRHRCGEAFLREFLSQIGISEPQKLSEAHADTEVGTADGRRIDILITWEKDRAIIIENKLNNAVDQPDQLKDYLKDVTEHKGRKVLKTVYIPLMESRTTHETICGEVVHLYPRQLLEWLAACKKNCPEAISYIREYELLLNYMNTVNINYMNAKELYDQLSKADPSLMQTAETLARIVNSPEWLNIIRTRILEDVKTALPGEYLPELKFQFQTRTSELWLWFDNYKYWISIDVVDKYQLYLYFDKKQEQLPDGIVSDMEGAYGREYWYRLKEQYSRYSEEEYTKMIRSIVDWLKLSIRK